MGLEPIRRRSNYVSKRSTTGHVVKGGQAARIRVDATGRMTIIVASLFTLEVVAEKGRKNERQPEKHIATKKELRRIVGALGSLFAVPIIESINPEWLAALPEGGEQNGGVGDE